MVSKSVFKIEGSLCFLSFFTFLLSVPGPVYRRDVMQSKKKKVIFSCIHLKISHRKDLICQ